MASQKEVERIHLYILWMLRSRTFGMPFGIAGTHIAFQPPFIILKNICLILPSHRDIVGVVVGHGRLSRGQDIENNHIGLALHLLSLGILLDITLIIIAENHAALSAETKHHPLYLGVFQGFI